MFQPSGPEHWYLLIRVRHFNNSSVGRRVKVCVIFNLLRSRTAWMWMCLWKSEETFQDQGFPLFSLCPFLILIYELSIVHWAACVCQSLFPSIDWIGFLSQEHRSWLHLVDNIKISADLDRSSWVVPSSIQKMTGIQSEIWWRSSTCVCLL